MFSVKEILAVADASAMLVSMVACDSRTAGDDGGKKEVSLQTWNLRNDKYTPYFEALIETYEKDHPDITVKWLDAPSDGYEDKLSSQATAGGLPDIVDGSNSILYGLTKTGALLDVSKQAPDTEKDYCKGAWESVTMQGNGVKEGAYDLPWYVNDDPTCWNTELVQKCGLDPSETPTTWDKCFVAGGTIVQDCKDIYLGTTMGYSAEDLMTAGVKPLMSGDHSKYTFNDEAGARQISRFVKLYRRGGVPPKALDSSWSRAADLFQHGDLVSMAGPAYSTDDFKQNASGLYKNLTVSPRISNDGKSTSVAYEMLGISANSKHPDAAIDFTHFVTNERSQIESDKRASVFPSAKGDLDDDYCKSIDGSTLEGRALKITFDQVKDGYGFRPAGFTDNNGYKSSQQQITLAMQSKQTVKEALDKSVEFANEKLMQ